MSAWSVSCPSCDGALGPLDSAPLSCSGCGDTTAAIDGIWRFVADDRRELIAAFLADYERVRRAEGRDASDPARWNALPAVSLDDPLASQWRMRAASMRHVLRRLDSPVGTRILDLGAGVGWLSNRLHQLGHHPCAVDLSADPLDGLGAAITAGAPWPCVQAEFDDLPFLAASADLAVFNASFHYASDPVAVLTELRRVLTPGGTVVIMDSPWYRSDAAGRAMAAERQADFERRFGTRSDRLGSIDYVTDRLLEHLSERTGVRWERSVAWYGWRWWWRPYGARLRGGREPSRFLTLVGRFD